MYIFLARALQPISFNTDTFTQQHMTTQTECLIFLYYPIYFNLEIYWSSL